MIPIDIASPSGSQVSCGICSTALGSESSGVVAKVSRPFTSTGPFQIDDRAEPSFRRSSHSGCRLATVGITAKLYGGGGDGVLHSSVPASHGFAPATTPRLRLIQTLTANNATPIANTNAPIVSIR